mgnify:CR=1 FL=1
MIELNTAQKNYLFKVIFDLRDLYKIFDLNILINLLKGKKVLPYLTAMVLQDSNFFIPVKTSTLEKSAIINTQITKGEIRWQADYARRQYYGVNFDHSKQKNPNARAKWFEAAKARWLEKWERFVNDMFKRS